MATELVMEMVKMDVIMFAMKAAMKLTNRVSQALARLLQSLDWL